MQSLFVEFVDLLTTYLTIPVQIDHTNKSYSHLLWVVVIVLPILSLSLNNIPEKQSQLSQVQCVITILIVFIKLLQKRSLDIILTKLTTPLNLMKALKLHRPGVSPLNLLLSFYFVNTLTKTHLLLPTIIK